MTLAYIAYSWGVARPQRRIGRLVRSSKLCRPLQALSDPELDQRLPGDAEAPGLAVEGFDDPDGKVDVDALELEIGAARLRPVDVAGDIRAGVRISRRNHALS